MSFRIGAPSLVLAFSLALSLAASAHADEKLPAGLQTKVEEMLRKEGFTNWDEIEMDGGMVEVDDAIDASGKPFDLKLDPTTLEIKNRKEETKSAK